jgi:hypothetical protein
MAALIAVGSAGRVLTSSHQLAAPLLLSPVLENTHRRKKTPVEGLTGRQARAGETMEKPLARKLVNPPQVFSSTSFHPVGSGKVLWVPKYCISTVKKFGSTSLPPEVQHKAAATPEKLGSTSLPLEVQHKAATTPDNFGRQSVCKIRSPLSGHLSLESARQMGNVLTFERFLTIHFAY